MYRKCAGARAQTVAPRLRPVASEENDVWFVRRVRIFSFLRARYCNDRHPSRDTCENLCPPVTGDRGGRAGCGAGGEQTNVFCQVMCDATRASSLHRAVFETRSLSNTVAAASFSPRAYFTCGNCRAVRLCGENAKFVKCLHFEPFTPRHTSRWAVHHTADGVRREHRATDAQRFRGFPSRFKIHASQTRRRRPRRCHPSTR